MEPEKKSNGAFVGLVIIIIILVVGGIYMWQLKDKETETLYPEDTITTEDSTELDSLEADVGAAEDQGGEGTARRGIPDAGLPGGAAGEDAEGVPLPDHAA